MHVAVVPPQEYAAAIAAAYALCSAAGSQQSALHGWFVPADRGMCCLYCIARLLCAYPHRPVLLVLQWSEQEIMSSGNMFAATRLLGGPS